MALPIAAAAHTMRNNNGIEIERKRQTPWNERRSVRHRGNDERETDRHDDWSVKVNNRAEASAPA